MLPWETAYQAASNFMAHSTTCCYGLKTYGWKEGYISIMNNGMREASQVILSFRRIPPGVSNELLANLWMFRNRLATLDCDKVYSFIGLLRSPDVAIQPDYQKPFEDLCCEVVITDIQASGNLHALRGIRTATLGQEPRKYTQSKSARTATWSTDWSDFNYWAEDQPRILTEFYKQIYSTSGPHQSRVPEHMGVAGITAPLQVAGRVFDSVIYTSIMFHEFETWTLDLRDLRVLLRAFNSHYKDTSYVGGGRTFSAFWRTLLGDCFLPYRESQDLFHSLQTSKDGSCKLSIRRVVAADCLPFLLWWFGRVRRLEVEKVKKISTIPAVININASFMRATSGRRMFITSQGYIGLGPEHTRCGDQVAVLLGGSTPFMLREAGSTAAGEAQWSLLGDCYVHGCMDGELVEGQRVEDWPMLVLR